MTPTTQTDDSLSAATPVVPRPRGQHQHQVRHHVRDDELRTAIAAARSWRGVLRALGIPPAATGTSRRLRRRADELGYSYEHFGYQQERWQRAELSEAVSSARTWADVMERLGCSSSGGSARDSIRRACARAGIDTTLLDEPPSLPSDDLAIQPRPEHLRSAGSMLVAAALALAGHRVSWPLEPAVYDLLVECADRPAQRVQVKTTTRSIDGTWHCSLTRSPARKGHMRYSLDDIDLFGVVDGDHVVYLIPAVVVGGLASIYTRTYRQYRVARLTV